MIRGTSLFDFPIHLGGGATALPQPQFDGPEWYEAYDDRHGQEDEGRIVSLFRFEEPWTSWEMHPAGDEVVCVIQGHMTLHQELPDGSKQSHELGAGEYAINPPGAWHTADAERTSGRAVHHGREGDYAPPALIAVSLRRR